MLSVIVLAAGLSRRMENKNKLLLPYRGKTIVENTVEQILAAGFGEVLVVTGRDAEQVNKLLSPLPVRLLHNPDYPSGMTSSIRTGIAAAKGTGFMICLADMPWIEAAEYSLLAEGFLRRLAEDDHCICVPEYNGRRGNPVIFAAAWRETIEKHGEPEGCRGILQEYAGNMHTISMTSDHVLRDLDEPGDYAILQGA